MALTNTHDSFGAVTKSFHWLTALLIVTAFPLGMIANGWPYETSDQLAVKAGLFTLHKTVGLMAFLVAALRILWAVSQPRPGPLHPERRWEGRVAEAVHWMLYLSMLIVPLSGWVHHASTTGFAPIWWPFGQGLPFVPVDERVAVVSAAMHWVFTKLLLASVVLHVAGAVKHHVVDRDATLRRMLPGRVHAGARARHGWLPPVVALGIYGLATAAALGLARGEDAAPTVLAQAETGWQVQEGSLSITVQQLGSGVTGQFGEWTAAITFDEGTGTGAVEVVVGIDSLRLGSVTSQAMGADFFDVANHPTAVFAAEILPAGTDFVAEGTLTLRGVTLPLALPFSLAIEGDQAVMTGQTILNRQEFSIGMGQTDEATLGFAVVVDVALTALRVNQGAAR